MLQKKQVKTVPDINRVSKAKPPIVLCFKKLILIALPSLYQRVKYFSLILLMQIMLRVHG